MTVAYIWFDLGYTLVYLEREEAYREFLLEQGIEKSLADIEEAYHQTDKLFMRQYPGALGRGTETFYLWYIGVLNYALNVHFDLVHQCRRLREIEARQQSGWRAFPETLEVLGLLKKHSYGIGLISNWDFTARTVLEENGLLHFFDQIVISSEVGVLKPDEAIFKKALKLAGVSAGQSLYVGDNYYDDVIGSQRVGMESCLINRFGRLGIEEIGPVPTLSSIKELPQLLGASS
ncbi:haloacid dehalogenase [Bacillus sp. FJAT-27264]|uniref:HAD family hydrolase n=1 Tax=Paenibacillus sp. (strain DSM 101736 / FJAT-27264) TaxID=1850362 RepID=UPI000807C18F|nr:HAD family hydrolase [Bacillus sp. FJAT-27264]OBZ11694.1 haloacid dehalogenase [Bacillus sp. FJAT-27264]